MHILLIDDDDELRTTLAEMLEDEGFRVTQAAGGREALEALGRVDGEPTDVIVLDYMMPEMSGADFREVQRARPDIQKIPVVLLTAAGATAELAAIAPAAVVHKPFAMSTLVRCIAEVTAR